MNIFIDALSARNGGGITYVQNLLSDIPNNKISKVYVAYQGQLINYKEDLRIVRYIPDWPVNNPILRGFWQYLFLPLVLKKLEIKLLFVPGGIVFTSPPKNCKLITMFRNMLPFDKRQISRYPNNFFKIKVLLLKNIILKSLLKSDKIIFISQYARNFLLKNNKLFKHKSTIIYHGVHESFFIKSSNYLDPNINKNSYILYVSRLEYYKNQLELINTFKKILIYYPKLKLVLIGPSNAIYLKKVKEILNYFKLKDKVLLLGEIDYSRLPYYYQNAELNIFCSETENCPNILLEKLASGKPVICTNVKPMPEFGGDAPLYYNPKKSDDIFKKIKLVLDNRDLKKRMAKRSISQAKNFTTIKSVSKTWDYLLN